MGSPTFSIRPATAEDSAAAVRVVKAVFDEYRFTWDESDYHADLYDLRSYYLDRGQPFLVAECDGQVVGTGSLGLFERVPGEAGSVITYEGVVRVAGSDCSLERLYVLPDQRGKGVGTGLLQALLDIAAGKGCSLMEIWSDKRFTDAHRLYERLGARAVGDRICHDPDQSPEWGLALEVHRPSDIKTTS